MRATRLSMALVIYLASLMSMNHAMGQMETDVGDAPSSKQPAQEVAAPVRHLHHFVLNHADAANLSALLNVVFAREHSSTRPYIVADPRTTSLIVTAMESDIERILQLVQSLDQPSRAPGADSAGHPTRVRMSTSIYEVRVPKDRLPSIRVDELTRNAKSRESLDEVLAEFGKARVLYCVELFPDLGSSSETVNYGAQVPVVRGTTVSKQGGTMSSIEYEPAGMILKTTCRVDSGTHGSAKVEIEFAGLSNSNIPLGNDVMAPVILNFKQQFNGFFQNGKPNFLLIVDAQADGDALVYVTSIQFNIEVL